MAKNRDSDTPHRIFRFTGLQFRLILLMLFAVIPAFIILLITARSAVKTEVGRALEVAHSISVLAAAQHNGMVEGTKHLLGALSKIENITEEGACQPLFSKIIAQYSRYDNFVVIGKDGRLTCSARRLPKGDLRTSPEWLLNASGSRGFYFDTFKIGVVTGRSEYNMSYPVVDDEFGIVGYVAAVFDLEWFNSLMAQANLPSKSTLTVVDSAGMVLARYPDFDRWGGKTIADRPFVKQVIGKTDGSFENFGLDGRERLFGFTKLSRLNSDIYLIVGLSKDVTYEPVQQTMYYIGVWAAFSALVLVAAWIAGNLFVMNKINALVRATRKLEAGDLSARTGVSYGKGELGELARAFDNMAESLQEQTETLKRSNEELEQFAYVASHDLQEPLRMIASYTQLLKRRYEGRLDDDADEFIEYAVDGATRMQALISDLLKYSRVGTKALPFEQVDLSETVATVLTDLQEAVKEKNAEVVVSWMPVVICDESQIRQLLMNLIGNSLKFAAEGRSPVVEVYAEDGQDEWIFTVKDNGIGIDEKYQNRIFIIFQRLHTRDEYPGTGIGLAICKKIVERHGGRIWAESEPGQGTSFKFTIPKRG